MNAKDILRSIINLPNNEDGKFDTQKFIKFFRAKNDKLEYPDEILGYEDVENNFAEGRKLAEGNLDDGKLIVCSFLVNKELIERSGKKAQYTLGKKILKEQQADAGIFIFYDPQGNFRFSLIYTNYLGKRRDWSNFKRFTYFVSKNFTNKTFLQRIGEGDFSSLEKIKENFSVDKVTSEFYKKLANWYFWALRNVRFPDDAEKEKNGREMAVIRLLIRLIFIWFMKEKEGLVPKWLFEKEKVEQILKDLSNEESTYYKAILQNLFFATLNTPQNKRRFTKEDRYHKGWNEDFGRHNFYRYHELFKKPDNLEEYFREIPFLNGGLFECLDVKARSQEERLYIDGFTRVKKHQPYVPNFLFFSEEKSADLNKDFGTKNKQYRVEGIISLLSSYNFTIDENKADDQDVALDPELLGKVFENLLASFNPETATTARKATGSYYTPREIVNYMVDESLKNYFETHLANVRDLKKKLELLFLENEEKNPFNKEDSRRVVNLINNLRLVDPAVGSGAFPMGALNRLVFILNKVDPQNKFWKETQILATQAIPDPIIRKRVNESIEKFFKEKDLNYVRKLYLIQKCLYGVDIQPIAVEIAKLRFFISLLVEEKVSQNKSNRGIEPLPNLDFKIMVGNSLVDKVMINEETIEIFNFSCLKSSQENKSRFKNLFEKDLQEDLFSSPKKLAVAEKVKNFINQKQALFTESDFEKKEQIRKKINSLENEIIKISLKDELQEIENQLKNNSRATLLGTKEKEKLPEQKKFLEKLLEDEKTLDQYKHQNIFLWQLHFIEVFLEKSGFDVVIANPPYIRQEKIREQKPLLEQYEVYNSTSDLYTYFYELGYRLLKEEGTLVFISSNKWMRAKYGEKLRRFFKEKTTLKQIIDFNGYQVFDATVDTNILLFQKASQQNNIVRFLNIQPDFTQDTDITDYFNSHKLEMKQSELDSNCFTFADETVMNLKRKIEQRGTPLKNWDVKIYRGVLTGFNEAFIIDTETKDRLCKEDPKSIEILKPILRGRDIQRYSYKWAGLWIIKIESGWTNKNRDRKEPETFFKESYPAVYKHLKTFGNTKGKGKGLYNRDDQGDYWWELRDCDYYDEFEKEKIVWQEIVREPSFAYDTKNNYCEATSFLMTGKNLKYLIALLNSKPVTFFFKQFYAGGGLGEEGYRYKKAFLEQLPIPKIAESDQKPFIDLVDKILAITKDEDYLQNKEKQAKVKEYEYQIDQMVYKLYGLTDEEIKVIEKFKK
jgi:anti-anti-sigma regulatory factor